jgi:translocation and assembly module TamB
MSRLAKSALAGVLALLVLLPTSLVVWIGFGARGAIPVLANLINGQTIGRYGTLTLSEVVETPQGATIGQISLADTKGAWIIVKDLEFAWNPKALLARRLEVTKLDAVETSLVRQPILTPPGQPHHLPINVSIAAIETNLRLAPGFIGNAPALSHQTRAEIKLGRDTSLRLKLDSASLSGPKLTYRAHHRAPSRSK